MKKKIIALTILLLVIDQIVKILVCNNLDSINIINNFLSLTYVKNYGVAFSFLSGNIFFIIFISIVLVGFIICLLKKDYIDKNNTTNLVIISFSLLLSGSLGNFIDRIVRGYVVDYINVSFFSIFNLADIFITLGIILLITETLLTKKKTS